MISSESYIVLNSLFILDIALYVVYDMQFPLLSPKFSAIVVAMLIIAHQVFVCVEGKRSNQVNGSSLSSYSVMCSV